MGHLTLKSDQDHAAEMASYTASILRINRAFPNLSRNNRAINSDWENTLANEIHRAMGYRREHF